MDYKRREAVEYTGLTDKGGIAERQEIMARTAAGKRVITVILSLMIAFAYMPIHAQDVFGAAKKPGTPKITYIQARGNTVAIKWSKAKNAGSYGLYRVTGNT